MWIVFACFDLVMNSIHHQNGYKDAPNLGKNWKGHQSIVEKVETWKWLMDTFGAQIATKHEHDSLAVCINN